MSNKEYKLYNLINRYKLKRSGNYDISFIYIYGLKQTVYSL